MKLLDVAPVPDGPRPAGSQPLDPPPPAPSPSTPTPPSTRRSPRSSPGGPRRRGHYTVTRLHRHPVPADHSGRHRVEGGDHHRTSSRSAPPDRLRRATPQSPWSSGLPSMKYWTWRQCQTVLDQPAPSPLTRHHLILGRALVEARRDATGTLSRVCGPVPAARGGSPERCGHQDAPVRLVQQTPPAVPSRAACRR